MGRKTPRKYTLYLEQQLAVKLVTYITRKSDWSGTEDMKPKKICKICKNHNIRKANALVKGAFF